MASWMFWTLFGLIGYSMISLTLLLVNRKALLFNFELWRGRKFLVLWKKGQIVTDYKWLKQEPQLGIKKGENTYAIDDTKGIRFRRSPIHVFSEDNIIEYDFENPPKKIDPGVYQKMIRRALASGVNEEYKQWIIIGMIILGVVAICAVLSLYFGYKNFELIRDYLVTGGVIKL